MIYNDNSCSNCGGIRVAKSTLCADCLGEFATWSETHRIELAQGIEIEQAMAATIISEKNAEIENLKYQLKLNQKILRHIFREYQKLQKLRAVDIVA